MYLVAVLKVIWSLAFQITKPYPSCFRLTGVIRDRCQEFSASELQSLPESVLVERVVAAMQSDIIGAIRSDSKYRVVINQQGFGDLMQRLIAILRPNIIKELQVIKSSLRAPVPPPPQNPKTPWRYSYLLL